MEKDFLIDKMNEELKSLQEKLVDLDYQISSHKAQTNESIELLADATADLEAMTIMKKQRQHEWTTALANLARRNDAANNLEKELAYALF
jgi:hypothetical protein